MNQVSTPNRIVAGYFLFFFSYFFFTLIFVFYNEVLGNDFQDAVGWNMLAGGLFMILSIVLVHRWNRCLRETAFYQIHFLWVLLLVIIGLTLHFTGSFEGVQEMRGSNGTRTVMHYSTTTYHIFVYVTHAFTFSTLILTTTALRFWKKIPIFLALASLAVIFGFFLLVV